MDDKVMINLLVELAGLEEELIAARALQTRNKTQSGSLGELQQEYLQDADHAESVGQETEVRFRNRENEIKGLEANLADRRKRLAELGDPRQIEAIKKEIDSMSSQLDELETQALELLDKARDTSRDALAARRQSEQQDEERLRQQGLMQDASVQAAAAEAELVVEIERLVGMLPQTISRHVSRLRKGLDQAVVYLANGACGGCFSQLPAQQGIAVQKGSTLIQCASCSRYVVHRPWR